MNWTIPQRIVLWDRVLSGIREYFRKSGLQEVSTNVRVMAPAIEPFIQPIASSGQWLATSPELGMKKLLCDGSGPIFQIAHVFRQDEVGDHHREEFHLVEWYRTEVGTRQIQKDVEEIVERIFAESCSLETAFATSSFSFALSLNDIRKRGINRWRCRSFLDLVEETTGVRLQGDEDAEKLRYKIEVQGVSNLIPEALKAEIPSLETKSCDARTLQICAWTQFFTNWVDSYLDRWLKQQPDDEGVHIENFPGPLAALAVSDGKIAQRFESYVGGVEVANGYEELRDGKEQRKRFIAVNHLRELLDEKPLPMDEAFFAKLESPGLPPCSGVAMGLERILVLACGKTKLEDILLSSD